MTEHRPDLLASIREMINSRLDDLEARAAEAMAAAASRINEEVARLRERVEELERLAEQRQRALEQVTGRGRGRPSGEGDGRRSREKVTCSVEGCDKAAVARGLCKNHYAQQRYREKREAAGFVVRPRKSPVRSTVVTSVVAPTDGGDDADAEGSGGED